MDHAVWPVMSMMAMERDSKGYEASFHRIYQQRISQRR